jgi:hypothetical protein
MSLSCLLFEAILISCTQKEYRIGSQTLALETDSLCSLYSYEVPGSCTSKKLKKIVIGLCILNCNWKHQNVSCVEDGHIAMKLEYRKLT